MEIRDSLTVDAAGLTLTRDGYVVGEAKVSRAYNVQQYYGAELGLMGDEAGKVFGVYRDPAVVFDEKSMLSLAGRPVTRGHPDVEVNASNWRDLAKGAMGGTIKRDGEHVVASMVIMDADSAKEVMEGARALSAGYTVSVVRDEGIAPDGTPYQFRQAGELRFNHVAYLPDNNPRAGNTRIGDAWRDKGLAPITPSTKEDKMSDALKTVVLGDKAVQVAVSDVAAFEAFKAESAKALADANAAHTAALAAKDAELAKKDAELDAIKAKVLSDADLDKRVQERADLIAVANVIAKDVKTEGLTDAAIRKAVVAAKLGDAAISGKADAYIDARFDILAEDAKKEAGADPFARVVSDGLRPNLNDATRETKAWSDGVSDLNAWRYQKEA
ncbi:DUF2213 domain-containing protein [Agrobacterium pusense]|uniref:DUF2213 domain-containing protein n=1 Tax=Agrobacterium pusense TaxID=648995 RepID=UPI0010AE70D0|nr:DUF2213 domain-containing protein [Agrobacterium pusense]WCK26639.1 DUF2213 domain-containing protein [Agrobacterium pusense]